MRESEIARPICRSIVVAEMIVPFQCRRNAGFSLVEVVMALGIMSVGLVPLMALLPIGLKVHRQAIEVTVASQIVARVTHEAQQTDYTDLTLAGNSPLTYCFDDQGNLLSSGKGDQTVFATCKDSKRIYDVRATVNQAASLPAAGSMAQSPSLARIQIDIASNPGARADVFSAGGSVPFLTYFSFVSKND